MAMKRKILRLSRHGSMTTSELAKRLLFPFIILAAFLAVTFIQYSSQIGKLLPFVLQQQQGGDVLFTPPTTALKQHSLCHTWDENTDEWWTHHPDWEVSFENDTHYCFTQIQHEPKARLYRQIYDIQYSPSTNCSNVITKRMISSGWGTDMVYVLDGLLYALATQRPFQMWTYTWHYAVVHNNNNNVSACPTNDMFCYFLNLTHCPANPSNMAPLRLSRNVSHIGIPNRWLVQYITRPQSWLRRATYQFAKRQLRIHHPTIGESSSSNSSTATTTSTKAFTTASLDMTNPKHQEITSSCVALHVRRADVVLHRKHSRRYHAISEYIEALHKICLQHPKSNPFIDHPSNLHLRANGNNSSNFNNTTTTTTSMTTTFLLLTDDANAIGEALVEYGSQYSWMYVDRPRHRGAEGGWENQIPSGDPRMEVVAILAEAKWINKCATTLVYSTSSLAYYFMGNLEETFHPTLVTSSSSSSSGDSSSMDVSRRDPLVAPKPLLINLDAAKRKSIVRSKENKATRNISRNFLP